MALAAAALFVSSNAQTEPETTDPAISEPDLTNANEGTGTTDMPGMDMDPEGTTTDTDTPNAEGTNTVPNDETAAETPAPTTDGSTTTPPETTTTTPETTTPTDTTTTGGDGAEQVSESDPFDPEEIVNWGDEDVDDDDDGMSHNQPTNTHTDENGQIPQADSPANPNDPSMGGHGHGFLGASTLATSASALVALAALLSM